MGSLANVGIKAGEVLLNIVELGLESEGMGTCEYVLRGESVRGESVRED